MTKDFQTNSLHMPNVALKSEEYIRKAQQSSRSLRASNFTSNSRAEKTHSVGAMVSYCQSQTFATGELRIRKKKKKGAARLSKFMHRQCQLDF